MTFCKTALAGTAMFAALFAAPLDVAHANSQCGRASWYELTSITASGERANPNGLTAAHRSLPFGTIVRVTNENNGRSVTVRINDRGPFVGGRIIDLTRAAAQKLGFKNAGTARVCVARAGRVSNTSNTSRSSNARTESLSGSAEITGQLR